MTQRDRPAVRTAVRLFGLATRLLPDGLLGAHGQDIRDVFEDEAREAYARHGGVALLRATIAAMADLVATTVLERRDRGRRYRRNTPRRGSMQSIWQDIRYAARSLRRQPAFAAIAVLTLSLGIGATTSVFTLLNAALMRPLAYPDADRIVRLWGVQPSAGSTRSLVNPVDAQDWRRAVPALESVGLWTRTTQPFSGAGDPAMIPVALVTHDLFDTLGTTAALGRSFNAEHNRPEHADEVIVSDGFWRRVLGGDGQAIGRRIVLADGSVTIIGVLPRTFASPGLSASQEPDVWRPYVVTPDATRGGHFMSAVGRLAPGATIEQAQQQMDGVMTRLAHEFPSTNLDQRVLVESLHDAIAGDARPTLLVLMTSVGLVLLIACANIANLLMGRASARRREMAVRGALGAGRWRILRQLLTESLLLSTVAAVLGTALAVLAIRSLPVWLTREMPLAIQPRIDATVLVFAVVIAAGTTLLFGLVPAIHASRTDLRGTLISDTVGGAAGSRKLQSLLLVVESALAVMLLVGAVLLVRSFANLQRVDPGFTAERVLTFRVNLGRVRYETPARRRAFFDELLARLRALPGTTAAGAVNMAPLGDRYSCDSFGLADRPAPPDGQEPCAEYRAATAGYFEALGIRLVEGRLFGPEDTSDSQKVILISDAMARQYWPDGGALGRRFKWGSVAADTPWRTIVGIVGDTRHYALDADPPPEVYQPLTQAGSSSMTVAVRTERSLPSLSADVRRVVAQLDDELPVSELFTTREILDRATALPRFRTEVIVLFALAAVCLAMIGVYSVMAFFVAEHEREIGLRVALGASPTAVRGLVVRRGMAAAGLGTACGLMGAFAAAPLLAGLLFGVPPTDSMSFALAPVLALAAAFIACYLPAHRATRLDPLTAIRND